MHFVGLISKGSDNFMNLWPSRPCFIFFPFLCITVLVTGTPILPPSLDFFNVATVQEILDEEQGSSLGECSRESTRNSRIASTSLGSSKLQRSTDRSVTETTTVSTFLQQREGKVINQCLASCTVKTKNICIIFRQVTPFPSAC